MVLTLYKKDTSAPCRSVFMVLEALGIKDVKLINMNLQQRDQYKDEYLKMNPQHTIPTLIDDDFIIWDSHAITTYLVNTYAKDDSLYPKDTRRRALVDQRLHFDTGVLFASLFATMVPVLYQGEKSFRPENLAKIRNAYDIIEKFFFGPWLTGDTLTLADICCVSTISSLNEIIPIDANLTMVLTLYKKDTSAPCRSVFMVLEALGIKDVKLINMNLQQRDQYKDEYLKMNPQHTIPTLIDDDFIIWDSHAITTYLVNTYAKDDSLYPKDTRRRALVDQRLHFDTGVLFASLFATMVPVLYQGEKSFRPENLAKIRNAYDIIEKFFFGPWLTGDTLTLADICCVSTISSLNEIIPIDANLYPNLAKWFARCSTQDFYVTANVQGLQAFREMVKSAVI